MKYASEVPSPVRGAAPTEIAMEAPTIEAPIEKVWAKFARIGDIYLNSPTVAKSRLVSDVEHGIGAARHMEIAIKDGATLDERVIEWREKLFGALQGGRVPASGLVEPV